MYEIAERVKIKDLSPRRRPDKCGSVAEAMPDRMFRVTWDDDSETIEHGYTLRPE